jgi:hypothetical protein
LAEKREEAWRMRRIDEKDGFAGIATGGLDGIDFQGC